MFKLSFVLEGSKGRVSGNCFGLFAPLRTLKSRFKIRGITQPAKRVLLLRQYHRYLGTPARKSLIAPDPYEHPVDMRITIGLGGSVFAAEDLDVDFLQKAADIFRELRSQGHEILVIVGGGKTSRKYIEAARELGASDKDCDDMGISITRLNARLLIGALGDLAESRPVESFERAIRAMLKGRIPVMGGTFPGQTTDAVAAGLANSSRSELLIFFVDVGSIYTSDPKRYPEARKLETMRASELVKLVSEVKMKPGVKVIVDPLAAKLIQRARLRALVLGREELGRLPTIIKGGGHSGTTVLPG